MAAVARELGLKPDTLWKQYRRVYPATGRRRVVTPEVLVVTRIRVLRGERVRTIARTLGLNPNTLASAYRRAGMENPHPGGNVVGWYRSREAEQAFRDWRLNARGRDGLDRIIMAIRVSWIQYPTLEDAPASVRPTLLSV